MNNSKVLTATIVVVLIGLIGGFYFYNNNSKHPSIDIQTKDNSSLVTYGFEEFVPPDEARAYKLSCIKGGPCSELDIDGFQTMLNMKVHSTGAGQDSSNLVFDSYGEGQSPNIYQNGDVLLTYTFGNTLDTLVVLKWGKLQPLDTKNQNQVEFKKI